MTFNETFEELCDLYTEGLDYRGRTPETQELIKQRVAQFKKNSAKLAEEEPIPTIGTTGGASPEPRKREDGEMEDCETCGCEENPEYGHFNDTYSNYIDHYEPSEDGERVDKDKMKCNSPKRGGSKKFVVKACENGKEKIVRFISRCLSLD